MEEAIGKLDKSLLTVEQKTAYDTKGEEIKNMQYISLKMVII